MKKFFLIVFFLVAAGILLCAGELEVGGSAGACFWKQAVGFTLAPEARWLWTNSETPKKFPVIFGTGAEIRYHHTFLDSYTQNEVVLLAITSIDYPLVPKLSLRGQLGLGGGWLGIDGGKGPSFGIFTVLPSAGLRYAIGPCMLNLLVGSELGFVPGAMKNILTVDLGATYLLKNISSKKLDPHEPALLAFDEHNIIRFYASGGTGSMPAQNISPNSTITLQSNQFTCPGFIFRGWATNEDERDSIYSENDFFSMENIDHTLWAVWDFTATSVAEISSISTEMVSIVDFVTLDENEYLNAADGSSYTQATSSSDGFAHKIRPFTMSAYEITYELWYTVRSWAEKQGYFFAHKGREGSRGIIGGLPTSRDKLEPVTTISWRDAMLWCNAYSQMQGKRACYYSDAEYTDVIKIITDSTVVTEDVLGSQDSPYVDWDANGYRLPTEGEWQYAASCGGAYAYNDLSGANSAWSNSNSPGRTHSVGTKAANSFGFYDMSGNVMEWCFDWYGANPSSPQTNYKGYSYGPDRIIRGGSWYNFEHELQVGRRFRNENTYPYKTNSTIGFRIVGGSF